MRQPLIWPLLSSLSLVSITGALSGGCSLLFDFEEPVPAALLSADREPSPEPDVGREEQGVDQKPDQRMMRPDQTLDSGIDLGGFDQGEVDQGEADQADVDLGAGRVPAKRCEAPHLCEEDGALRGLPRPLRSRGLWRPGALRRGAL